MDDEEKLSTLFSRAVDIHVHVGDHNHRDGGLQRNGQREQQPGPPVVGKGTFCLLYRICTCLAP